MLGLNSQIKAGTYTGTGAAQAITLGFRPTFVITANVTDGDAVTLHINGMTDASSISIGAAAATVTNAITFSSTGFTAGSDNSVSENAKVFRYWAVGGYDGAGN